MTDRVLVLVPPKAPRGDVARALELGFHAFVVEDDAPLDGVGRARVLRLDRAGLHEGGKLLAPRIEIASAPDQEAALALAGAPAVLVEALDWRVIPYENLIAAYRRKGTRLYVRARDAQDAKLLLETLERGVDAVILPLAHAAEAARLLRATQAETLVAAKVTAVRPVGMGDRACLDTAVLLAPDEGVLTGNAAGGLLLVASEAHESGYVASRPFRVNAGAVHAYALAPGDRTRYLSELRAGDEVLAVRSDGATRAVVLGRVKIERRPMLLVEAQAPDGRRAAALLQNAETVRLLGPAGAASVAALKAGDEVFARFAEGGRHFGMGVDETLLER